MTTQKTKEVNLEDLERLEKYLKDYIDGKDETALFAAWVLSNKLIGEI